MLARLMNRRSPSAEPLALVPGGPVPVMARIGRPGSLTEDQLELLEANRFLPPPPLARLGDLSEDEAATILAALDYARAAIRQAVGEDAPTEVENELLGVILADDGFAGQALRWAQGGRSVPLKPTALFTRLQQIVLGYWQPAEG
jgi:hypothetical protein